MARFAHHNLKPKTKHILTLVVFIICFHYQEKIIKDLCTKICWCLSKKELSSFVVGGDNSQKITMGSRKSQLRESLNHKGIRKPASKSGESCMWEYKVFQSLLSVLMRNQAYPVPTQLRTSAFSIQKKRSEWMLDCKSGLVEMNRLRNEMNGQSYFAVDHCEQQIHMIYFSGTLKFGI